MADKPGISPQSHALLLTGNTLTIEDVVKVARERTRVALTNLAVTQIHQSRQWIEKVMDGRIHESGEHLAVYGVNTPFGSLAFESVFESPQEGEQLSRNLIMSHAAGVGDYFPEDIVRAATLIRANTLIKGFSGVRKEVIESLLGILNADIYPAVPEKGSVGASGDLAPLSHLVLTITKPPTELDREEESGEVFIPFVLQEQDAESCCLVQSANGEKELRSKVFAKQVMESAGVQRHILQAKEGLALNNGATFCAATAAIAVHDAEMLVKNAEIALAMTLESVKGYRDAFFPQVHKARGHQGQIDCASNILLLVEGSNLLDGDQSNNPKICPPQDAYSIRCAPQVIGSVRDVVKWVRSIVETELNAATDNPLIFPSDDPEDEFYLPRSYKAISCGNFHGEPLAFAMDFLGIAIAELGSIAERRIFRILTGHLNRGLESMLVRSPEGKKGMQNGFMIPQYTAAALVSDNKTLAHPDSVDSIPTCEDQEDHVSMAANAARHAREIIWNVQQIVGIEMLCASQALDLRLLSDSDSKIGKGTKIAYDVIRKQIAYWSQDRIMHPDMEKAATMVSTGEVVQAVYYGVDFSKG
jgi:histidine ammonia-lyase